jgi:hypothetical protein
VAFEEDGIALRLMLHPKSCPELTAPRSAVPVRVRFVVHRREVVRAALPPPP